MFMSIVFLLRLLADLVAIVLLGRGPYLLYQWRKGSLVSDRWLYLSIGLLLRSRLGFLTILLLHRPGQDEPSPPCSNRVQRLVRPDGSEIQVEFYGPERAPTQILSMAEAPIAQPGITPKSSSPISFAWSFRIYPAIALSPLLWLMSWLSYLKVWFCSPPTYLAAQAPRSEDSLISLV